MKDTIIILSFIAILVIANIHLIFHWPHDTWICAVWKIAAVLFDCLILLGIFFGVVFNLMDNR